MLTDSKFAKKFCYNLLKFGAGITAVMLIITALDKITGINGAGILTCLSILVIYMIWGATESQIINESWEKKDK
tara:strand:+ start:251 stop:472 length:222 start_codon:yes stop_codon:yes gene_type:complete